jgi:hypothetical protein
VILPREPSWRAVAIAWAIAVALLVAALLLPSCACRPAPSYPAPAPMPQPPCGTVDGSPPATWAEYVRIFPHFRYLSPAADHPCWKGSGQVCGAGKCG